VHRQALFSCWLFAASDVFIAGVASPLLPQKPYLLCINRHPSAQALFLLFFFDRFGKKTVILRL
jgi:hypothetical protein